MSHREPKASDQTEQTRVVCRRFANELLGSAASAIVDQLFQKDRAESPPFDIRSDNDREFGAHIVRIRHRTHDSECLESTGFALAGSDECHFPIVVDLRQARELSWWKLTYAHEYAIANIVLIERVEELDMLRAVLGLNGPQEYLTALPLYPLLELLGVGPNGESIHPARARGRDAHARIERKDAMVVGQK